MKDRNAISDLCEKRCTWNNSSAYSRCNLRPNKWVHSNVHIQRRGSHWWWLLSSSGTRSPIPMLIEWLVMYAVPKWVLLPPQIPIQPVHNIKLIACIYNVNICVHSMILCLPLIDFSFSYFDPLTEAPPRPSPLALLLSLVVFVSISLSIVTDISGNDRQFTSGSLDL